MRSRIAIFEGYSPPRSYGGPIVQNARTPFPTGGVGRYGRPQLGRPLGRRAYYVPPAEYRPEGGVGRKPRAGYRVKAKRNTPAMKRAMNRFKKAAKSCSRRRKGSFQACMKKKLKSKR